MLPVLMILLACKPTPYQMGVKAAAEGQLVQACEYWMTALEKDLDQEKPRDALLEYGPDAFEELVDLAQDYEAERNYAKAITAYEDALAFGEDLATLEVLEFSLNDVRNEIGATRERWAQWAWDSAIAADEEARWSDAIGHFETLRELKPDHPELDSREGLTYLLWAEDDLANQRYAAAAEHYRSSFERTGHTSSRDWAGAIELALGSYGLEKGACRYAVEHLELAGRPKTAPTLDADLARARDCARIGLDLELLEQSVQFEQEGLAIPELLMDQVQREVERQGSRFLVLLAGEADNQPEVRYDIGLRLTSVLVEPAGITSTSETVEGYQWVPCDRETLMYEPEAICSDPVDVSYQLNRKVQRVRVEASVKIVDPAKGEQKSRPLNVTLEHDTTYADGFMVDDGEASQPVSVDVEVDEGKVEVPRQVAALDRDPEPLPPPRDVLRDAVDLLAESAATVIVEAVDVAEPPPEPRDLTILDPTTTVNDLDFARPEIPEPVKMVVEPLPPAPEPGEPVPEPAVTPAPVVTPAPGETP